MEKAKEVWYVSGKVQTRENDLFYESCLFNHFKENVRKIQKGRSNWRPPFQAVRELRDHLKGSSHFLNEKTELLRDDIAWYSHGCVMTTQNLRVQTPRPTPLLLQFSFPSHRNAPVERECLSIEYVSVFPKILSDNDKDKTEEKQEM